MDKSVKITERGTVEFYDEDWKTVMEHGWPQDVMVNHPKRADEVRAAYHAWVDKNSQAIKDGLDKAVEELKARKNEQ